MQIIKFGGSSLLNQNAIDNTLSIIVSLRKPLLVVISAIGRKGFPFATDTLIESIGEKKISPKEYDRLLSLGEIYASIYLSNLCKKKGIKSYAASYLEIGMLSNEEYGNGRIDGINSSCLDYLLKKYEVVIIPGFVAHTGDNEIITLGRNTSDYSCVLLASVFKEKNVYLYKDVRGIYPTSINSINNKIRFYERLSYDEMISLCSIGFKVVSKKAVEEAKNSNIDIVIVHQNTRQEGSIIGNIESKNKLLGFNIVYDEVFIASIIPDELYKELELLFKTQHIFIKEYKIYVNYLTIKINVNQMMMVKKLIYNLYLDKM